MASLLLPVAVQAAVVFLLALVVAVVGSLHAGMSLLVGGLVIWFPNLLLALRLCLSREEHFAVVLLAGKLLMWVFAGLALWAVATAWPEVSWPGLIGGLVAGSLAWLLSPLVVSWVQQRSQAQRIDALVEGLSAKGDDGSTGRQD